MLLRILSCPVAFLFCPFPIALCRHIVFLWSFVLVMIGLRVPSYRVFLICYFLSATCLLQERCLAEADLQDILCDFLDNPQPSLRGFGALLLSHLSFGHPAMQQKLATKRLCASLSALLSTAASPKGERRMSAEGKKAATARPVDSRTSPLDSFSITTLLSNPLFALFAHWVSGLEGARFLAAVSLQDTLPGREERAPEAAALDTLLASPAPLTDSTGRRASPKERRQSASLTTASESRPDFPPSSSALVSNLSSFDPSEMQYYALTAVTNLSHRCAEAQKRLKEEGVIGAALALAFAEERASSVRLSATFSIGNLLKVRFYVLCFLDFFSTSFYCACIGMSLFIQIICFCVHLLTLTTFRAVGRTQKSL